MGAGRTKQRSYFLFQYTKKLGGRTMIELKTILMAEDNPQDVELTIEALTEHNLANHVVAVGDGVEVLEYLNYEGPIQRP